MCVHLFVFLVKTVSSNGYPILIHYYSILSGFFSPFYLFFKKAPVMLNVVAHLYKPGMHHE